MRDSPLNRRPILKRLSAGQRALASRYGQAASPLMQLRCALQEWALVCQFLAEGSCSVLLRKGGIHERHGRFEPKQGQFLLMPTFLHQDPTRLRSLPLQQPQPEPQQAGTAQHRLSLWVEVTETWQLNDEDRLLDLAQALHWPWSDQEIRTRFAYRNQPFLYVMLLRAYHLSPPCVIPDQARYAGCKSWLELEQTLDCDRQQPVLSSADWDQQRQHLVSVCGASQ